MELVSLIKNLFAKGEPLKPHKLNKINRHINTILNDYCIYAATERERERWRFIAKKLSNAPDTNSGDNEIVDFYRGALDANKGVSKEGCISMNHDEICELIYEMTQLAISEGNSRVSGLMYREFGKEIGIWENYYKPRAWEKKKDTR